MIKWLIFALIAAVVLTVYAPSLMHLPRADQVLYLSEVASKHYFYDLTIGCLDLNRHRTIAPGDEILFRPIVYIILGLEKFLFQYQFMWWHLVGVVLHLLVVWLLLRLLLLIEQGAAAYLAAAFFALLFVNTEMVTWDHINGYMVFVVLMLLAFLRVMKIIAANGRGRRDYLMLWILIMAASFTHEIGNVLALIIGALLLYLYPRRYAGVLLMMSIPCIYAAASSVDALINPITASFKDILPVHAHLGEVMAYMAYAIKAWLFAGLFPNELDWVAGARVMIAVSQKQLFFWPHLGHLLSAVTVVLIGLTGVMCCRLRRDNPSLLRQMLAVMALGLILAYTGIIVFGRGYEWTMFEVIRVNTYYMYIFWVLAIILFYALFSFKRVPRLPGIAMGLLLVVFMAANANHLYAFNMQQVDGNKPVIVLIRILDILIKEHGQEKDFSFYVDMDYPGNFLYPQMVKKGDPPGKAYSFVEALYPQYFNRNNPKYRFLVAESKPVFK